MLSSTIGVVGGIARVKSCSFRRFLLPLVGEIRSIRNIVFLVMDSKTSSSMDHPSIDWRYEVRYVRHDGKLTSCLRLHFLDRPLPFLYRTPSVPLPHVRAPHD